MIGPGRLEDMKLAVAAILHGKERPTRISLKPKELAFMLRDAIEEIEELKKHLALVASVYCIVCGKSHSSPRCPIHFEAFRSNRKS